MADGDLVYGSGGNLVYGAGGNLVYSDPGGGGTPLPVGFSYYGHRKKVPGSNTGSWSATRTDIETNGEVDPGPTTLSTYSRNSSGTNHIIERLGIQFTAGSLTYAEIDTTCVFNAGALAGDITWAVRYYHGSNPTALQQRTSTTPITTFIDSSNNIDISAALVGTSGTVYIVLIAQADVDDSGWPSWTNFKETRAQIDALRGY